jgi:hypothetical protein
MGRKKLQKHERKHSELMRVDLNFKRLVQREANNEPDKSMVDVTRDLCFNFDNSFPKSGLSLFARKRK